MVVAVVVLAVVAIGLAVLLVLERRRSTGLQQAAADAAARHKGEASNLRADLDAATTRADVAERRHTDTVELLTESDEDRRLQAERLAPAEQDRDRLAGRVEELERRIQRLQERLTAARDGGPVGGNDAALWALELARSERTWRHSVAPLPLGPSPFADAEDPLRLAVEVEAAALREEVGAPLEVRWDATVTDPSRSLLVLRLAQELLASAARGSQAAVLDVSGSEEVVLHLTADEGDEEPVEVTTPPVPEGLVSVEAGDGLRIVVHPG